ncbi:MAG: CoB--CoM heterodisulfide reductase iron-sulfur subunit B family protein [Gammaproteobacteria bacterium]|jgi:heterodisulfide reductase subunit B2
MPGKDRIRIPYYPGCTLKTKALGFERSAMDCARAIGFELDELKEWNCCGASFPLIDSNLMGLAGPTNVLIEAENHCRDKGIDPRVITLCSFCYNTLKRTGYAFNKKPEKRATLNAFLDRDYQGTVKVEHYLEFLRDSIGFDKLAEMVKVDMSGFKVAPYYGCLLLKPGKEIALDDPEEPTILHDFIEALGCTLVDFPGQVNCCGSYLIMREPEKTKELSNGIIDEARAYGAQSIVTACPLCHSNLDRTQAATEGEGMPIFYFTQLLAIALGISTEEHKFEQNSIDPLVIIASCSADASASKQSA